MAEAGQPRSLGKPGKGLGQEAGPQAAKAKSDSPNNPLPGLKRIVKKQSKQEREFLCNYFWCTARQKECHATHKYCQYGIGGVILSSSSFSQADPPRTCRLEGDTAAHGHVASLQATWPNCVDLSLMNVRPHSTFLQSQPVQLPEERSRSQTRKTSQTSLTVWF